MNITDLIPLEAATDIATQAKWFFAGYFAAMPFMLIALGIRIFRKLGSSSPEL
jgi:3-hydroxymyristoyl/3-hydroxydecanoyl-(acyl carrier protein) dehydratase